MKKSISKSLELKKISRKNLINLQAGEDGGPKFTNGTTTTCGDEPADMLSLEYVLWDNCVKSNSPRGGTEFCSF